MKIRILFLLLSSMFIFSCIQDDFIMDTTDPEISITSIVDTIAINSVFQFESRYLNNIGASEAVALSWSSSDPSILDISDDGAATALSEGTVTITVTTLDTEPIVAESITVSVGDNTVTPEVTFDSFSGDIVTTTFYELTGSFTIEENENGLLLDIGSDYRASSGLPGLYIYLSNNRNSIGNALEVLAVSVFNGAHSYQIPGVALSDYNFIVYYCKPFNVKVGEAVLN